MHMKVDQARHQYFPCNIDMLAPPRKFDFVPMSYFLYDIAVYKNHCIIKWITPATIDEYPAYESNSFRCCF